MTQPAFPEDQLAGFGPQIDEGASALLGVGATGSDGFREYATATVRCDAGGAAAFVAAVAASTNPTVNPDLDHASDGTFNGGGGASSIVLTVAGSDLVVTVTNQGVGANNFLVFFEVKGFAT